MADGAVYAELGVKAEEQSRALWVIVKPSLFLGMSAMDASAGSIVHWTQKEIE